MIKKVNKYFSSRNIVIDNNTLWLITNYSGILCKFRFPEMIMESYYILPKEESMEYSYLAFCIYGNYIYIAPYMSKEFVIFDVKNEIFSCVKIPYKTGTENNNNKFHIIFEYNENIYLIGQGVDGIFKYDIRKKEFQKRENYIAKIEDLRCVAEVFSDNYFVENNMVYIPINERNMLFIIDLDSREQKLIDFDKKYRFRTIDKIEEKIILTTFDKEKVTWDTKTEEIIEEKIPIDEIGFFWKVFVIDKSIVYIVACDKKVYLETEDGVNEIEVNYDKYGSLRKGYTQFEATLKNSNGVFFQARTSGQLFFLDIDNREISEMDFYADEEEVVHMLRESLKNEKSNCMYRLERSEFGINDYLLLIKKER